MSERIRRILKFDVVFYHSNLNQAIQNLYIDKHTIQEIMSMDKKILTCLIRY